MSFSGQLTKGSIQAINNEQQPTHPIVQIIDIKKIQAPQPSQQQQDRYRLVLSDGVYYQPAMLATQLNGLVRDGILANYCVVKLIDYTCNLVQNRKIVIVVNLEQVSPPLDSPIGTPQNIESLQGDSHRDPINNHPIKPGVGSVPMNAAPINNMNTNNVPPRNQVYGNPSQNYNKPPQNSYGSGSSSMNAPSNMGNPYGGSQPNRPPPRDANISQQVTPINELSPYVKGWMIRARVTSKSDIRSWSNVKGTGKLFSVDLLDEHGGEIRATVFTNAVDTLYPLLEVDKVYYISKGSVKMANKKFTNLKNEYEISLDANSHVTVCNDNSNIPKVHFSFVPISDIRDMQKNDIVDVLGIIIMVSDIIPITTKNNTMTSKRNITILDKTRATIEVSVWGPTADNLQVTSGDVVAFKGLRISDYNDKSLSAVSSTHIELNCDRPEAKDLYQWYNSIQSQVGGGNFSVTSLTKLNSGGPKSDVGGFGGSAERKLISQVADEHLGEGNNPAVFTVKATITMIRTERPWYNACIGEKCQKKVTYNTVLGVWQCEKCKLQSPKCLYRYILGCVAVDHTGSLRWMTGFNEVGSLILGVDASVLAELKEPHYNGTRDQEYNSFFQKANFKSYIFKIRAKEEQFQENQRVKYQILEVSPIKFAEESRNLIDQIHKLSR